ncbi:hypothetical protein PVK64_15255 [Aliivibrio sp. S4TY2]|uniref:hypothetical protein n=1 Tax=unclassified Aliivibrio TaxID=2645654 RepID=UPI002378A944|nr:MULTISPECIES: hypothetical protein [unclassified Aliivibrio]MDD9157528.1 hypothetical protein [Aliivibrio sp. S4TY2]MDD9161279.1 hypothetical protein [Aliivibrio sp. S4TY1]MDD9165309.1 hypothetical protein [Aliivibrio sp. S4MY2]MDD9169437.1 hypothetical protein [Aliivibrio sp. S4MY4]MDD9186430.1 hypothetical protein [Aliivibrio sp. S4MY3]
MYLKTTAVMFSLLVSGCASTPFGQLEKQHTLTNESTAVVKVFPNNFQIGVYAGIEKEGYFIPEKLIYDDQPSGDFAVLNVKGNQLIAILDVKPATSKKQRQKFSACYGGGDVYVFEIPSEPEPKAYYTYAIHYRYSGGRLSIKSYDDFVTSKDEFSEQYPNIIELEKLEVKTLKIKEGC